MSEIPVTATMLLLMTSLGTIPCVEHALQPGDRLVFFTDGITEAHGEGGKMFGHEPIRDLAMNLRDQHPAAVIDELMKARQAFLGAQAGTGPGDRGRKESSRTLDELSDDATLVILDL